MKGFCAICILLMLAVVPARAQQRYEQAESDGFVWTKVMGGDRLVGALDADDSLLVPMRYCYIEYQKGFLLADSCVDDQVAGVAVYDQEGRCLIPAERQYVKVKPTMQKGAIYLQVRVMMDRKACWGVCDIYGNEIISPLMYADLMENPRGMFYYTEKGFAVKRDVKKNKLTYIGIFVDEEGRMYQLDAKGEPEYLTDYQTEED